MKSKPKKPKKPRKDFPLYAHNRGYWAKKIKGKVYYFGRWDEPEGAIDEYKRTCDDLYAGRTPSPPTDAHSLLYCANLFTTAKESEVETSVIKQQALNDHKRTLAMIIRTIGPTKHVKEISALDLLAVQQALYTGAAPTTRKARIGRARTFFNWLYKMDLIERRLSEKLTSPSKSTIKKAKNKKPKKLFSAKEINGLIKLATGHMKPCIWLAINCAYGNRDCVELKWSMIGKDGWIDFPRSKTGVERRCKLWPETIKALNTWRKVAPKSEYVVCDGSGRPVGADGSNSPIANQFAKIEQERNGRGFYSLRHTFRTVADACKDVNAVRRIMGHIISGMDGEYIEQIGDDRLEAVTEHVRRWLKNQKTQGSGS